MCNIDIVPLKQSPDYKYQLPELTKRKRRQAVQGACVPSSNTDHCTISKQAREAEVKKAWDEMSVKYIYHKPESDVKAALGGCFLDCGTCLEGSSYLLVP